jgi:hydrogenase expression/formation protein HypE
MSDAPDLNTWSCPLPLRDHPNVIMGHGGGGKLSAELIEHLFRPAFDSALLDQVADATVLTIGDQRMAYTTDSFVVKPLFFPGGSIADLAVNGTINDLAMSGAQPLYLSVAFILEEGLPMNTLGGLVQRMGDAARNAGVSIAAGDTKVVDRGHGDGVFINTSGIGLIPDGVEIAPNRARPGDAVIVSGTIGDHGMAIMSVREGLAFDAPIASDTAPLHGLVEEMLKVTQDIHALRDPTRGGVASSLNEIAQASRVGIAIDEHKVPVNPAVQSACEILGMDPIYVANEGKLIAIVARDVAEPVLGHMRQHRLGGRAAIIGHVTDQHPGMLVARTGIGGTRVIPMQIGEQLPRIC